MSNRDRAIYLGNKSVEVFASYTDKYLQDYKKAIEDGDDEELVAAAVAMWQLSKSMGEFFKDLTLMGIHGMSGQKKAAIQDIATRVAERLSERMHEIAKGGPPRMTASEPTIGDDEVPTPVLPPSPNRDLN